MITVEIRKNVYAKGNIGKRANYVVKRTTNGFVGVRGQRPVLASGRFKRVKPSAELRGAFA